MLPEIFGIKLLEGMKKKDLSAAVIVVTGIAEEALDIETLKKGALYFVTKPIDLERHGFLADFHIPRTASGVLPERETRFTHPALPSPSMPGLDE
jgi:DNA-binding NtrC family response regulator